VTRPSALYRKIKEYRLPAAHEGTGDTGAFRPGISISYSSLRTIDLTYFEADA
jgi:hypothetical protein